jgi:lipopolysaccharide export LptBFGC system permease protein LptF
MGVNIAALVHYKFRSQEKVFLPATMPILGFVVSAFIWLNLNHKAQWLGTAWIAIGLVLYFIMRGRKGAEEMLEVEEF